MSSPEIWYVANRVAEINFIVASAVGFVLAMILIQRKVDASGGLLSPLLQHQPSKGPPSSFPWFKRPGCSNGLKILSSKASK